MSNISEAFIDDILVLYLGDTRSISSEFVTAFINLSSTITDRFIFDKPPFIFDWIKERISGCQYQRILIAAPLL
ncbi:MAG: hypothetical protein AMQ74_01792 [Candidatus Methanofastidiosum methylothiophilum]|uniref:Uncharacterized protein n=1 Tax=Candidatus Methanofastidiosum methylothiophilum TaxID=1705564 RepID=A0A150INJ1_9EURY|nr:MAG: hypothetical protein AMQ74_01792 [Candidatus Methanofastidiosum methylthiophilus]